MGRRENDASASVRIVPHSQEHFHDIGDANRLLPRPLIFPQHVHLPASDLVTFDGVLLGEVGAHVFNEAACDLGRQFYRFAGHRQTMGAHWPYCESDVA